MHAPSRRCRYRALAEIRVLAIVASMLTLTSVGCVDADALDQSRNAEAHAAKFAEIDLGEYQIALPHLPGKAEGGLVNFHAFGKVEQLKQKDASKSLRSRNPRLRAEMLTRVRSLTDAELEEPELRSVREEIAMVVNETLEDQQIKNVGFYSFSFTPL